MVFTQNGQGTFVRQPRVSVQNFIQGVDVAATYKTVVTAGPNGSKVVAVIVCSQDTANAHVMSLAINRSATRYPLGSANCAISAGTNGFTPPMDIIQSGPLPLPVDNDGQKYLFLESGDTLDCTFASNLNTSQNLYVTAIFGDF